MRHIITILTQISWATLLNAEKWQAGVRLYHSDISGVRTFDADQHQIYDLTDNLLVPSFYIKRQLAEKFNISAEYSYFNNIQSKGVSPNSDIFNEGGNSFPAFTQYKITEDIQELSFSFLYEVWSHNNWTLNLGPTLSFSFSDTDFKDRLNRNLRTYTETDVTIGFQTGLEYQTSRNFVTGVNYRFSNLPHRDVHLFGVSLGMKW